MEIVEKFTTERMELDAIIASGIFDRAPKLAKLLSYVCLKHFEGTAHEIKEYNIAVDAFGRHSDFDQRRDSIVRVEAHRLRKRLREYYDEKGADYPIRIDIPSGQYAPRFIFREEYIPGEDQSAPGLVPNMDAVFNFEPSLSFANSPLFPVSMPLVAPEIGFGKRVPRRFLPTIRYTGLVLLAGALLFSLAPKRTSNLRAAPVAAPVGADVRIDVGAQQETYTDSRGHVWSPDTFFQGGTVFHFDEPHPIAGTRDQKMYQNRREGQFTYDIPLRPGIYEMWLHFAETFYGEGNLAGGAESTRVFAISMNGKRLIDEMDVISDVGSNTADIRVFTDVQPAGDGKLHLKFEQVNNGGLLNAIEIIPGIPGQMHPVRLLARDRALTDSHGNVWEPDTLVRGGNVVPRHEKIMGADDPDLFRTERFGNLTYSIPVAMNSTYSVKLHFAESWFGPNSPAGGGVGSRLFDILINGVAEKRRFDVFQEAGGNRRAIVFTAGGVKPNASGRVVVQLAPIRNYAFVNAVEVIPEPK